MAVLERGWGDKGVRFGEEPWPEQQYGVWRGGIPTAGQTISQVHEPKYEQSTIDDTGTADRGSLSGRQCHAERTRENPAGKKQGEPRPGSSGA